MKAIQPGDRGPAVEDIQRRLRSLGYDLGPTGVDGAFQGMTAQAVQAFQADNRLAEDCVVGEETWAALVDATFTLGDRMLYLRMPHFHGHDVMVLQQALNALGFACGASDGIFGTYCERALGEFQRNAGLPVDGIAGDDTIAAILSLRHVWEGKEPQAHSAAHVAAARAADVLTRVPFAVTGLDDSGRDVADRVVNLAHATTDDSRAILVDAGSAVPDDIRLYLQICGDGMASASSGRPVVRVSPVESLHTRLLTAIESSRDAVPEVTVELDQDVVRDVRDRQRTAVRLLDAVCVVFD